MNVHTVLCNLKLKYEIAVDGLGSHTGITPCACLDTGMLDRLSPSMASTGRESMADLSSPRHPHLPIPHPLVQLLQHLDRRLGDHRSRREHRRHAHVEQ